MVFGLMGDVSGEHRDIRLAYGECAIAVLPGETAETLFLETLRRRTFQAAYYFRKSNVLRQRRENMDMVFYSADLDRVAI